MRPAPRIDVLDLFAEERRALLDLLSSLTRDEWQRPTICDGWSVKDLAGHILGDDLGHLSWKRDGYSAATGPESWDDLVGFINHQNALWVEAMRRLSPRAVIELLESSGERNVAYMRTLDLDAIGDPVDWAGPEPAPVWMHIAREYTERWLHQQQIRDAVARPGLTDRHMFAPVLDTFVRALPHTFRDVASPDGTHVRLTISGEAGGTWSLLREADRWVLFVNAEGDADAAVQLDQDAAWRLFTKGLSPTEARAHAILAGDTALAAKVLDTVSILA